MLKLIEDDMKFATLPLPVGIEQGKLINALLSIELCIFDLLAGYLNHQAILSIVAYGHILKSEFFS